MYESYRHVMFGAVCPLAVCLRLLIIIDSIDKSRNPPEWFGAFPSALYLHLDVHIFLTIHVSNQTVYAQKQSACLLKRTLFAVFLY